MSFNQQEIIDRFEKMREFIVDVEIPDGKKLSGVIPYQPLVTENKGRFKIYATSYDEAKEIVSKYLNA